MRKVLRMKELGYDRFEKEREMTKGKVKDKIIMHMDHVGNTILYVCNCTSPLYGVSGTYHRYT